MRCDVPSFVRPSRQLASFMHARKSGIIRIIEAWMDGATASSPFPCPKCQMAGAAPRRGGWESHQHRTHPEVSERKEEQDERERTRENTPHSEMEY